MPPQSSVFLVDSPRKTEVCVVYQNAVSPVNSPTPEPEIPHLGEGARRPPSRLKALPTFCKVRSDLILQSRNSLVRFQIPRGNRRRIVIRLEVRRDLPLLEEADARRGRRDDGVVRDEENRAPLRLVEFPHQSADRM